MSPGLRVLTPLKKTASGAAWTPASKTGLKLWFDATQETGLVNSDPMSTLHDWSGAYSNGVGTTTTRPLYKTSIQNGKPGILFDGTDDFFDFSAAVPGNLAANHAYSWIIVAQYTTKGGGNQFGVIGTFKTGTVATSGTINKQFAISYVENQAGTYGNLWNIFNDSSATNGIGDQATWVGATHTAIITTDGSSTTSTAAFEHFKDGTTQTLQNGGSSTSALNKSFVGKWESGTLPFKGYLFEMFAYDSKLSAGERTSIAAYILAKWGV
jgi:hypothetical protein